jgi:hypothetical protein
VEPVVTLKSMALETVMAVETVMALESVMVLESAMAADRASARHTEGVPTAPVPTAAARVRWRAGDEEQRSEQSDQPT